MHQRGNCMTTKTRYGIFLLIVALITATLIKEVIFTNIAACYLVAAIGGIFMIWDK